MSTDPFRSPPEELAALTKELAEVRAALRDLGQRLGQIERHAKRAFGVSAGATKSQDVGRKGRGLRPASIPPTMSANEALGLFKRLVADSRARGRGAAEEQLSEMEIGDLRLMAQELGLPGGSKPSKRALVSAILGRINESLLLSQNTNVTLPRSAQDQRPQSHPDGDASQVAIGLEVPRPPGDNK